MRLPFKKIIFLSLGLITLLVVIFFFFSGQPESKKQSTNISEMDNTFLVSTIMSDSLIEIYYGRILAENRI